MDLRMPNLFGSTLLLLGAFVLGEAFHRTLVQGTLAPTSPAFVFAMLLGGLLVYAGYRLEEGFDPSEYVPDDEDEEEEEAEFDESMSPLDADQLEGRDKDESYDG